LKIKKYKLYFNKSILIFRTLKHYDSEILGKYFINLSDDTKRWYSPNPFTYQFAQQVCKKKEKFYKRIVGIYKNDTISYCVLSLKYRKWERIRYKNKFKANEVCEISPSVADNFQNRGIGTLMMKYIIKISKLYNKKVILLWGGVVIENIKAVNFYKKFNFKIEQEWLHPIKKVMSYDMFLRI
jgi:RimJ/RimL family protein N-acetyltransferase